METVNPITANDIFARLGPYNLKRVTFQMPDGLPVITATIDRDERGGAVITLSDESHEGGPVANL